MKRSFDKLVKEIDSLSDLAIVLTGLKDSPYLSQYDIHISFEEIFDKFFPKLYEAAMSTDSMNEAGTEYQALRVLSDSFGWDLSDEMENLGELGADMGAQYAINNAEFDGEPPKPLPEAVLRSDIADMFRRLEVQLGK